MWLFTRDGFYSIVDKAPKGQLCVRARAAEDLDLLRDSYLPTLGKTITNAGTDYPFRAFASREAVADAAAAAVRDITYTNFKNEVKERRGVQREAAYHSVWAALLRLEPPLARPVPSLWGRELDDWEDDYQEPYRSTLCPVCGERVPILSNDIDITLPDDELLDRVKALSAEIGRECEFNDTGHHYGDPSWLDDERHYMERL